MSDANLNTNTTDNRSKLNKFFEALTENESREDLQNYAMGLTAIVFTCAAFYIAYNDPKAMTDKFYVYCIFCILPAVIGIAIASNIFAGPADITKMYFYGGTLIVFIIALYMFYKVMNPNSIKSISYLLGFLSILAFIVGLAIVYRIFVRTIMNTRGWFGFVLKFLFLIPCLLIELIETIFSELKAAPKMVIVLFVFEILIVLAYIYIPRISKPYTGTVVLLNKPTFLTNRQSIGHANQLFMDVDEVDNPHKTDKVIRQNYSISMWFYVNQHSNTSAAYSKETNIFRYGRPNSDSGHPRVSYFNDVNDITKTDKYIVYVNDVISSQDSSGIMLDIPTQSWNQLVISYNKSVVDIFVNGDLARSVPLAHHVRPNYDVSDIIEVGYGDNTHIGSGLHGAICNVVYYKTPLTPFQVAGDYNSNRYKNPPVNN